MDEAVLLSLASLLRAAMIHGMFMRKQPTPGCGVDHRPSLRAEFHEAVPSGGALSDLFTLPERKGTGCRNCFTETFNGETPA